MKKIDSLEDVTFVQLKDPKCPQEILQAVVNYNKWDPKAEYALMNPNCPEECLAKIVNRAVKNPNKNNYDLAICALHNPSCPMNVLEMVISRSKKDILTGWAKNNPKLKKI